MPPTAQEHSSPRAVGGTLGRDRGQVRPSCHDGASSRMVHRWPTSDIRALASPRCAESSSRRRLLPLQPRPGCCWQHSCRQRLAGGFRAARGRSGERRCVLREPHGPRMDTMTPAEIAWSATAVLCHSGAGDVRQRRMGTHLAPQGVSSRKGRAGSSPVAARRPPAGTLYGLERLSKPAKQ
jgi:hypothetical protein